MPPDGQAVRRLISGANANQTEADFAAKVQRGDDVKRLITLVLAKVLAKRSEPSHVVACRGPKGPPPVSAHNESRGIVQQ